MAEKDTVEKILESYNDVFADIVNVLLFGGEQILHPEELEDQSPRSAYKVDEKIRDIERDVAKRWIKSNIRIACIGFENQTDPDPDMVLRVYGYDGAEYRWQCLKENRKLPRYPVVTLVLYFGYRHHWDKPTSLHEAIEIPDCFKPYVPDHKINVFEIAWLSREQVNLFRSDFKVVADYFVQKRENGDYVPSPEKLDHVKAVLELLSVMEIDSRFEEVMNMDSEKGVIGNMCDVLDRAEERGMKQGIQQGIQQNAVSNIRSLMETMSLNPKQAMDALKIPAADQPKYAEMLTS